MKGEMNLESGKAHLTLLQLQALLLLKDKGEMKMQDVSEHFNVAKPTSTSLLNKLVKLGMVKRISDKEDRRVVKVSLTSAGEEMFHKGQIHHEKKLNQLLSYLSVEDKTNLVKILKKLSDTLKKEQR